MPDWYEKRTLGSLPDAMARKLPDREALVFEERRFTFAEVAVKVDRAAKALMALGVRPGDHVCLWLNNCDDWIFVMYGLAKIGAVQIPVNTRFRTRDLAYVLHQSDSAVLITHDVCGPVDYLEMVRQVVRLPVDGAELADSDYPRLKRVVIVSDEAYPGTTAWQAALHAGSAVSDEALRQRAEAVDCDAPALMMYTSGTTGFPKGVVHTHNLVRNVEERAYRLAITPHDVILNYLPLFHAFGYSEGALTSMLTGARQVVTPTFDASACLDLVEREGVTLMHGFETHMKDLSDAQERKPRDLRTLRTGLFAAGMHSATPICRRGSRLLAPFNALSGYGMTEVWIGAALGALDDNDTQRIESSGYPAPGYDMRIVDPESGALLGPNMPGELQVRGYCLMLGYYNKPEETAACYTPDGWFRTGDTAYWRDDGYLRFLGRIKDMLKVGGENVDPMEVEGLLLEHPGVNQVAVVALADDRLSEIPVAFVQPVAGYRLEAEAVIRHCRGKLASFKLPRHVVFVEDFPMTASGKIRKTELRDRAQQLRLGSGQA